MTFDLRGDQTHVVVGVCLPSAAFLFFFYARDHHGTELPALLSCAAVVGGGGFPHPAEGSGEELPLSS